MKRIATLLALIPAAIGAQAQLTITDSLTLGSITTLLEGIGVTVSNVTVNCPERSMGHFIGPSELSITEGLVLTTGSADMVAGPVAFWASQALMAAGDADLELSLGGGMPSYDACVLEFDCVPQGDTLLFNFSFGSEEYQEYVGAGFNDVFAIYLSGPGFNPPVNVAAIPGGTIVSINNVNDTANSGFYHNNETIPGQYVTYDGFSTNLTAFAVVVPGLTYHFKVAIADVADPIFDSGVFLEAFSFRSPMLTTGIGEQAGGMRVIVRPDEVQLSGPDALGAGQPVLVYNMGGQLVQRAVTAGPTTLLPLDGLKPGLYVVHLPGSGLAPVRFVRE